MKNKINVRFIIFVAIAILILALVIFGIVKLVNSGKNKDGFNEITPEEYTSITQKEGYTINDITDSLTNYSYIKSAVMAVSKDGTYEIEYYKFEDEDSAYNFLDNKKMAISMLAGSNGTIDDVENDEYAKYSQETETYYCVVFKVGSTVVCSDVKVDQKDEVNKVLNKLGYMD